MTMTPNELPQMYVLMVHDRPVAAGTSLDSLKAEGTKLFNEKGVYWNGTPMVVDNWNDVSDDDKFPDSMVAVYFGYVIYKVARA